MVDGTTGRRGMNVNESVDAVVKILQIHSDKEDYRVLVTFYNHDELMWFCHELVLKQPVRIIVTQDRICYKGITIILREFPFRNERQVYGYEFNEAFGYHQFIELQLFNIRIAVERRNKPVTAGELLGLSNKAKEHQ
jgi:hypothetical protein